MKMNTDVIEVIKNISITSAVIVGYDEKGRKVTLYPDKNDMDKIQAALKRDEPKKPKDLYSFEGSNDTFGNCPICGDLCNDEMKFCDKCGQVLDWGN